MSYQQCSLKDLYLWLCEAKFIKYEIVGDVISTSSTTIKANINRYYVEGSEGFVEIIDNDCRLFINTRDNVADIKYYLNLDLYKIEINGLTISILKLV